MPKYTNIHGIKSRSIIDALTHNDYDLKNKPDNIFSCTEILDAPKAKVLSKRYREKAVIDVSDSFHMLDGSAVHYVLEMSNKKSQRERLAEERLYIAVPLKPGQDWECHTAPEGANAQDQKWYKPDVIYVSAKFDCFEVDEGVLEDYKRTSVWEAIFGLKDARVQQLNIGGFALKLLGFNVNTLRACLDLKDWSATTWKQKDREARQKGFPCDYPPIKYKEFEVEIWQEEKVKQYIMDRVNLHLEAHKLADDEIPPCNKDERWCRDGQIAVMKKGVQRSKKNFGESEREAAQAFLTNLQAKDPKGDYYLEERPGNDTRCNGDKVYCHFRQWCNYWKQTYGQNVVVESEY